MKLRYVIIREPILIEDPVALELWQKALWAKASGYRQMYRSGILPIATDDFFATHLIIARELPTGELEPVVMYKSLQRSLAEKYSIEFSLMPLIQHLPPHERDQVSQILQTQEEITYDSSWAKNPRYHHNLIDPLLLREHITTLGLLYHETHDLPRWFTAGVVELKIDQYFAWLGCRPVSQEISLPIIDQQTVKIFYMESGEQISPEATRVCDKHMAHWHRRLEFGIENQLERQVA